GRGSDLLAAETRHTAAGGGAPGRGRRLQRRVGAPRAEELAQSAHHVASPFVSGCGTPRKTTVFRRPSADRDAGRMSTYTHGHHESVLRSHSWRTAANSAAHLVPLLTP